MMAAAITFAVATALFSGWPYIEATDEVRALEVIWHSALLMLVPWAVLGGLALVARARPALEHATSIGVVQMYAVSVGLFALVTGPFESPGWILCIGGCLVGFLLFTPGVVFAGVVTFQLLVCAGAVLLSEGLFGLEGIAHTIGAYGALTRPAIARLASMSVFFSYVTLMLASHIIVRWRMREAVFELQSKTDGLTGLSNRRYFVELLTRELARASRYDKPLSLVFIDLDHFKRVNDTRGHAAGDAVLVAVAGVLRDCVRELDVACRHGGEEFAILLPETPLDGARELATRLSTALAAKAIDVGEGEPVRITMSIGIASVSAAGSMTVDDFMRRADAALYEAKNSGRDRIVIAGLV